MKTLSRADEILLLAILRLKENAYGVTIKKEVHRSTGKKLTFGSIWVSLDILHRKGYIRKHMADPIPQRRGRPKIYYTLTSTGIEALKRTRDLQESIWDGASVLIDKWKPS